MLNTIEKNIRKVTHAYEFIESIPFIVLSPLLIKIFFPVFDCVVFDLGASSNISFDMLTSSRISFSSLASKSRAESVAESANGAH